MKISPLATVLSAVLLAPAVNANNEQDDPEIIEKIEVRGELLPTVHEDAANAVEIITSEQFERLGSSHIQDVLQQLGNVNFAGGSSRARFIQIRGIGERSQFVDPIIPSVGIAIDGIDYSGLGTIANTFDIERLELFKGPQGTTIGANAMAGYLNLYSTQPGEGENNRLMFEAGNYGHLNLGAAYGGEWDSKNSYRVSVSKLQGDGYIENTYLDKSDTNGFDELALRGSLKNIINDDWALTTAVHYFDLDNGYDAFSLDNTRETMSDTPGYDRQETQSIGITSYYRGLETLNNKVFVSVSKSDTEYAFDEDWAYPNFYPNYEADFGYNSFDAYHREHDNKQIDVSFSDKPDTWVAGLYYHQKSADLDRLDRVQSNYDVENVALYGEKRFEASKQLELSVGVRIENYQADYKDSNGIEVSNDEVMVGGHLSAINEYRDNLTVYVRMSRGFKPGGFNGEALSNLGDPNIGDLRFLLLDNASFETETLDNFEMGIRGGTTDGKIKANANIFYSSRDQMQVRQWITDQNLTDESEGNEPIFIGYISNAPSGANYGLETNLIYKPNYDVTLTTGFSLIETEVKNMVRLETDPNTFEQVLTDIDGRAQAHAPSYQYFITGNWRLSDRIEASVTYTGKDKYFYSISHDEESEAVHLLNASMKYIGDTVDITLWARNITDEEYGVRGFFFGNDPRDGYTAKKYEQLGEPAVVGVRFDYSF